MPNKLLKCQINRQWAVMVPIDRRVVHGTNRVMHVCQEGKGHGTGSAVLLDHFIGERGGGVNRGGVNRGPRRRQEEATEREVSKVDDLSTDCCAVVGVLWKGESKMAHPAKKSLTKHGKKAAKMRSWVYTASVPLLSQLDHTDRQATQGLLPTCLQLWQWHQSPHNPSQLTITSAIHYPSHAHSRRLVLSWFGLAVLLWQSVREVLWHVCVCFFILLKISRLQVAFLQQDHTTQKAFESPLNKGLVLNLFRIVARNKVSSEVQ